MSKPTEAQIKEMLATMKPPPIFNGTDLNGKPYYIWKGKEYSLWALWQVKEKSNES